MPIGILKGRTFMIKHKFLEAQFGQLDEILDRVAGNV